MFDPTDTAGSTERHSSPGSAATDIIDDLRDAGLPIRRIARLIFVCQDTIYNWRADRRAMTPDAHRRLADLHAHLMAWGA